MTSFHRKTYDKAHGKARRKPSYPVREDGKTPLLRYGRHTTLASFSVRDAIRTLDEETDTFGRKVER